MKKLMFSMLITLVAACSSNPRSVLYTMEDTSQPSWANEGVSYFEDGEKLVFVGIYEAPKTTKTNMNAVRKASDIKAMEQIATKLKTYIKDEAELQTLGLEEVEEIEAISKKVSEAVMTDTGISERWYRVFREEKNDQEHDTIQHYSKVEILKKKFVRQVKTIAKQES